MQAFPFKPPEIEDHEECRKLEAEHNRFQEELEQRLASKFEGKTEKASSTSSSYYSGEFCERMDIGGIDPDKEPD